MTDDQRDPLPTTKCPGCGIPVELYSNCGRYRCITELGAPILLDPIHRREREKREAEAKQ